MPILCTSDFEMVCRLGARGQDWVYEGRRRAGEVTEFAREADIRMVCCVGLLGED